MTRPKVGIVFLLTIIIFFVIGALAILYIRDAPDKGSFITVPARRGRIASTIFASGSIEPVNLISVGAQVSGRVVALHVELGQEVTEGQRIAEIDSVPQMNTVRRNEAALSALQAQRNRVKAVLKQTEFAFHRQGDIIAGKAGTRQEYEAAEAAYASAQADLAALDAQIEGATVNVRSARTDLAYTQITAPMNGTVVAIVTKQGQTVISSQIAPTIVRLADLGTMSVKAKISEADIDRLRPGMPVYFNTLAQPDRRYETTLKSIDPAPDQIAVEQTGMNQAAAGNTSGAENPAIYFNARFEIANEDGALKPLMTAMVGFVLKEAKDAVLVPAAALQRTSSGQARLRILDAEGRPQERSVRTGLANGVEAQVLDGVSPGEAVIVADAADGARLVAAQSRAR